MGKNHVFFFMVSTFTEFNNLSCNKGKKVFLSLCFSDLLPFAYFLLLKVYLFPVSSKYGKILKKPSVF